jgi:hypothetical protein
LALSPAYRTKQSPNLSTTIVSDNQHFYRETNLLKQASAFASMHADVGPLNNMFSSKLMIKNKLNQVKFPNAYERDGNDLMRPVLNFKVQPLQLQMLTQGLGAAANQEEYLATLKSLK